VNGEGLPAAARPPLYHGGRLGAARRLFPDAPEPFIDLSTGINPRAYPVPALPTDAFTRLPEPESLEALQRAASGAYGATHPAMVVAAPGTQALIALLPRLRAPARVAVVAPTYAEHTASWRDAGHAVREIAAPDIEDSDILVVGNPNNPDGRRHDAANLAALAERLAARGGWLVIDEAFADFEPRGLSTIPLAPRPGLIVLRSFGKAYGLAGLRLGFAVAEPVLAATIRSALGPWPVSGPALATGCAALSDAAWLRDAGHALARDVSRLDGMLTRAGMSVVGGTHLFRLARLEDAVATFATLGRAGILVRRFPDHSEWLRFGIPGDPDAFARLADALDSARVIQTGSR
jgi:cobalamin biosynthetic protein CobC